MRNAYLLSHRVSSASRLPIYHGKKNWHTKSFNAVGLGIGYIFFALQK